MKTMKRNTLAGLVVALAAAVAGCNKETTGGAATAPQEPASSSNQATPRTMGPGMHDDQGMMQGTDQTGPGMHGPMMSDAGGSMMDRMRAGCPMMIADADVEVSDTDKGIALTFTTQKGDVADLRARVQRMAQMYEMHQERGSMMWHQMGQGRGGMGAGRMNGSGPMPSAKATVEETDRGARLVLTPTNASELGALRQHVRAHQQRMQSGECWMWNESAPTEETK